MKSTKTNKRAGAAAPKSTIDIILDKLQPSTLFQLFGSPSDGPDLILRRRAALVAHGEEALRILQIKRACLMPKKDTSMVRAALAIDYLSRNASDKCEYHRATIPVQTLAKVVGFDKKDVKKLEMMQTVMKSYLDGSSIGKKQKGQSSNSRKRGRPDDVATTTASTTSSSLTTKTKDSLYSPSTSVIIRDLCIRLGPMIPDAEFATSYATRLLNMLAYADVDIERMKQQQQQQSNNTSKRGRFSRHELKRDMERHREYYEAACFYLAVKKSEGGSYKLKQMMSKKNAAAKKKDSKSPSTLSKDEGGIRDAEGEDEDDPNDDDRPLHEADVISAANLLEGTFKTVLDYVKDWTEGLAIPLNAVPQTNHEATSSGTSTKTLFEVAGEKNDDGSGSGGGVGPACNNRVDDAFEQWKQKVLSDAKTSAMKTINEGGAESKDWLTVAADEVLRKAGL